MTSERHITRLSRSASFNWASGIACNTPGNKSNLALGKPTGLRRGVFASRARQATNSQRRERLAWCSIASESGLQNLGASDLICDCIRVPKPVKESLSSWTIHILLFFLPPSKRSCYGERSRSERAPRSTSITEHGVNSAVFKAEPLHKGEDRGSTLLGHGAARMGLSKLRWLKNIDFGMVLRRQYL